MMKNNQNALPISNPSVLPEIPMAFSEELGKLIGIYLAEVERQKTLDQDRPNQDLQTDEHENRQ